MAIMPNPDDLRSFRRGWIGMTWPRRYGGADASALQRYVVLEELLAAGAPTGGHWIGDRQSGPLLLRAGTESQRRRFLPAIAKGEMTFCIGMSEPGAGSDLSALSSTADAVDGGWTLNGRKVWTTNAHLADYMIGLFRSTRAAGQARHAGMSQFLIDLKSPGIQISPIHDLAGGAHFNEVTFDDVFVPADMLVGTEGEGWAQVTAELTLERSGPERYLSAYPLLGAVVDRAAPHADDTFVRETLGRQLAHLAVLRQMSLSVACMLDSGKSPAAEAAVVKDLGNAYEQSTPEAVRELLDAAPITNPDDSTSRMLAYLIQTAPSFSLRGGTREILRGIIARELGLR